MVITVPKPINTRQENPTAEWSIPVELVPTKTKTTNESAAPTCKRRKQNDDEMQPIMNDNQLNHGPAKPPLLDQNPELE
jgi:hypothetical protein